MAARRMRQASMPLGPLSPRPSVIDADGASEASSKDLEDAPSVWERQWSPAESDPGPDVFGRADRLEAARHGLRLGSSGASACGGLNSPAMTVQLERAAHELELQRGPLKVPRLPLPRRPASATGRPGSARPDGALLRAPAGRPGFRRRQTPASDAGSREHTEDGERGGEGRGVTLETHGNTTVLHLPTGDKLVVQRCRPGWVAKLGGRRAA